jgi:hypothetical protein
MNVANYMKICFLVVSIFLGGAWGFSVVHWAQKWIPWQQMPLSIVIIGGAVVIGVCFGGGVVIGGVCRALYDMLEGN